jgi:SAM-dependent methyltransferase
MEKTFHARCGWALEGRMSVRTEPHYWEAVEAVSKVEPQHTLWRAHSDAVNSAWLAQRLPTTPSKRLLKTDLFDEALATGLQPVLATRAQSVVGIDVATSTVRSARGRYAGVQGVAADVRALPFATSAFDGIVSNSTLDHFDAPIDIVTSLKELYRVLRPGGQLLLTLDNLANPVVALRNALPFRPLNALGIVPYQIGVAWGPRRLRRAMCDAGFEVLEVEAILHCPRVFAVAVARVLERYAAPRAQQRYLERLLPFERLAAWRTRFLTGYFVAVVARKP